MSRGLGAQHAAAVEAHACAALRLNNHKRYFRTHFAGTELEYKFNLTPGTDIWATAMELLLSKWIPPRTIQAARLAGSRCMAGLPSGAVFVSVAGIPYGATT